MTEAGVEQDEIAVQFTAFYNSRRAELARWVGELVGDPTTGEDLAHDAFGELYRNWNSVTNPHAWMVRTCRNMAARYWRSLYTEPELVADIGADVEAGWATTETNQERGRVERMLDALTPKDAELFRGLADGHTAKELGHRLGMTKQAVEVRARRIVQLLTVLHASNVDELLFHPACHLVDRDHGWAIDIDARKLGPSKEPINGVGAVVLEAAADLGFRWSLVLAAGSPRQPYFDCLTTRRQEVLDLALAGYDPVDIAARLGITPNNARVTKHQAVKALAALLPGDRDRAERLVRWAIIAGELDRYPERDPVMAHYFINGSWG